MLRTRINLAKAGVAAYDDSRAADAVKAFQAYIRVLEDWKGVHEGAIVPALFDQRREVAELLLISGVYWDLVKLFDRTKSAAKQRDFLHYMEKFILFSQGMPYETVCRETLRKYISTERPVHLAEFKNAYKVLGGGKCFVATALMEHSDPQTIPRLRAFRARALMRSPTGRAFVRWYYRRGPALAARVERLPVPARRAMASALDILARSLG
jgi:hypothetical protein